MASYNLANQAGASFRAALNVIIASLQSNAYGTTDPATGGDAVAGMWWVDTGPTLPTLKMRNVANTAWITIATLNGADFQLESATLISPTINTNFTFDGNVITGFTGSDVKVVTGTAGTSGNAAIWNADGDVVDGGVVPSAGGMVFIESQDASTSANLDFTGFNASLYDSYVFKLANVLPTGDIYPLYIRTSTDGGSTYDSGASDYSYSYQTISHVSGPTTVVQGDNAGTLIALTSALGNVASTDGGLSGTLDIFGPHLAQFTHIKYSGHHGDNSGIGYAVQGSGRRLSQADVNAVRFSFIGTSIASGTITMYGLRNS